MLDKHREEQDVLEQEAERSLEWFMHLGCDGT